MGGRTAPPIAASHRIRHPSPGTSSDAAISAASSSRTTAGDRVRLPVLINALCPHREQTKMRGSGTAVGPTCLQFGHVIWVSIGARCYRHGERVARE